MTTFDAAFDPATLDPRIHQELDRQPQRLVFVTISGAHLYGFPSPDSDFDLRGAHLLPAERMLGLDVRDETLEISADRAGLEVDLVTHDLRKFVAMMLKRNGYVLEQLHSPLIIRTSPLHEELKRLAHGCVTRHHVHHYKGFAHTQWELFHKERPRRVKPLLYVYRVLLTGIHLMRTGRIESNLPILGQDHHLPYLAGLIHRKTSTKEKALIEDADLDLHEREFQRLAAVLERAAETSTLPDIPSTHRELEQAVIEARLGHLRA
ncbi:MAG: nucleotidyltransferase domain-containing protein [Planctomycetes bacterium]|nr:nucleotidyltransferase domain-containing protein [Planctomycetota bacterium]